MLFIVSELLYLNKSCFTNSCVVTRLLFSELGREVAGVTRGTGILEEGYHNNMRVVGKAGFWDVFGLPFVAGF